MTTPICSFEFQTKRGLAEGALAYTLGKRTILDRLLGRERVHFGIGLCSPRDRNEKQIVDFALNRVDGRLKIEPVFGEPRYVPGKTEELAANRLRVQLAAPRKHASDAGLIGSFSIPGGSSPRWSDLRDLVLKATPTGWWGPNGKPWSSNVCF